MFDKRLLNLTKDFSQKRESFGKKLMQHPLHARTLEKMEVKFLLHCNGVLNEN